MNACRNMLSLAPLLVLVLPAAPAAGADLALEATANRNTIYLGESVIVTVKVSGDTNPPEPDLSALSNCRVQFRGSQSKSHYSIQIVNGQLTRTGFSGREFTYEVTPTQAGSLRLGPIALTAGGQSLTAFAPTIQVQGIEAQPWVNIEVAVTREAVLVDEPFEVRLTVSLRRLPPPYHEHDPLDPANAPRLHIPYLDPGALEGLQAPDVRQFLQGALVSQADQPGFGINDYSVRTDPFNGLFSMAGMFDRREARFMLPRHMTTRDGQPAIDYELKFAYVPERQGNYTFGPVTFKGPVITGVETGGRIRTESVFAVGPAVTVRVVPPPEEGRPASYIGAIGSNLTVHAALDTQTCNVGDPLTLTLTIGGDVNLANAQPPPLSQQPQLLRDFRVYEDSLQVDAEAGMLRYRYTIRPTRVGTYELPPIAVAYYDVRSRAYRTVHTDAIPIRANQVAEVVDTMIIRSATNGVARIRFSSAPELVTAPVTMDPAGAEKQVLRPSRAAWLAGAVGPLFCALVLAGRGTRRWVHRKAPRARRLAARRAAQAALVRAGQEPDGRRRCALLAELVRQYLSTRFDRATAGLAPAEVRGILEDERLPPAVVEPVAAFYERVFNASFGGALPHGADPNAFAAEAGRLVAALDAAQPTMERKGTTT